MKLPVSIIVAVADNGVIGSNGDMPWKLSSDLKRFKSITMGNPIIMGRKTFESIGRALPGRHNIVVTRQSGVEFTGAENTGSIDRALELARHWAKENNGTEICILGGGEIYRQSMEKADKLYITEVSAKPDGDTKFPEIDTSLWEITHEKALPSGPKDTFDTRFLIYRRR